MSMSDPLGDMLTRIRNGQRAGKPHVVSPKSRLRMSVLEVLRREGYIRGFAESHAGPLGELRIELKYYEGAPVIRSIRRVSTPGRRVYSKIRDLKPYNNGLGISILSTPQGVMTDHQARARNVGGEILCRVF